MEIQTLRYFTAVAREENMTRAAGQLHITQPALSKRLKALEEELGKKLFTRRSFSIRLTDEGRLLLDRAKDLLLMADKIEGEFAALDDVQGGELRFGLAESFHIRSLAAEIKRFRERYPALRYHITSGDTEQVADKLQSGLLDLAVLAEKPDFGRYEALAFPQPDVWGVVMPASSPLAAREGIRAEDLEGMPLFCSLQGWERFVAPWCGGSIVRMDLEGTFRLSYNGAQFVHEGLGLLLTFDRLVDTSPGSGLAFRPLRPRLETTLYLVRDRDRPRTRIARSFWQHMAAAFGEGSAPSAPDR